MKNKNIPAENMLDKVPQLKNGIKWTIDENSAVTLEIENKGIANKIAQLLLGKPRTSFIHLDEIGSFIWLCIDGKKNIFAIGKEVNERFGDKSEPLYERLTQYFEILENYDFIVFK